MTDYHILDGSAALPTDGRIAVQGVKGANSQTAAEKMFPHGTLIFFRTFEGVFEAVKKGLCRYGVVPIENNTYGSVRAVYDLLKTGGLSIVKSERLLIHHELLANPGAELADIKEIYSHEQALGQCSRFIKSLGSDIRVIPTLNTAGAARDVAENGGKTSAAIASPACAELYGLKCLKDDIQDSDNNYTRFVCLSASPAVYPGANRMTLMLTVPHRPGALYDVLGHFARLDIDMLKLESAPIPGRDFEFLFYIDIAASVADPKVRKMLDDLEKMCPQFCYLGNYSEN